MQMHTHVNTDSKARARDTVIKTFAIIGLVVVLVVAGWVGFRAAQHAPNALSAVLGAFTDVNISRDADQTISVSITPTVATSTENVTIEWESEDQLGDGSYTLRYDCRSGLHLEHGTETIFCNTPFRFVNTNDTLVVRPVLEASTRTETTVSIDFTPNGKSAPTDLGSAPLIVLSEAPASSGPQQPGNVQGTSVTVVTPPIINPVPGNPQVQTFPGGTTNVPVGVSDPNGTPDLVIRILDTGIADRNGNFTVKDPVDEDDQVAVRFEVRNVGTKSTGAWRFEADLPTRPSRTFRSPSQQSLLPNERIEYVIGFDRVDREDEVTVRIEVDEDDDIDEINENNNTDSVDIEVDH